jgi:hypothetical protein
MKKRMLAIPALLCALALLDWHWVVGVNLWGPSTCAGRFYPECSSAAAAIS